MRVLALDVGRRRVGLAISDHTCTLARPLTTITLAPREGIERIVNEIARLAAEEDGLSEIVVGLPVGLSGSPTDQTEYVSAFIAKLRSQTTIPVVTEGEALTSREAESRLALRERDWRKRKERLDAAAAAIILQ